MSSKQAILLIHPGFEEMEAVAPYDLLIRAGVDVTLANVDTQPSVRGRCGMVIQTPVSYQESSGDELYDLVILPGGPGIKDLRKNSSLCDFIRKHHEAGKIIACICAAPLLLLDAELLPEKYTAHHSTLDELPMQENEDCVWAGNILTSRGAGTATQFGLALVEAITDKATRQQVAESICWK